MDRMRGLTMPLTKTPGGQEEPDERETHEHPLITAQKIARSSLIRPSTAPLSQSLHQRLPGGQRIVTNPLFASPKGDTEDLHDAELFEKDYVQNVRERPYRSTAKHWLINGSGIGAILALPFGPIGLLAGLILGAAIGLCFGLIADLIKLKKKYGEIEKQQTKIKHLMRWAEFHFSSSEDQLQLLFKVISEYQALAAVGGFSPTARAQLKLLYKFLKRDDLQHVLWTYLDYFFSHWRRMTLTEISMCNTVFEVCIQCCNHLKKKRPPVVQRMEDILAECPAVIRLFAQAESLQRKQRERAVRERDWLMYADAGEMTAQEVFRRNMAYTKTSIIDGPIVTSSRAEEGSITPQESLERVSTEKKEEIEESESEEEDDLIPERDPKVVEVVMSEESEESEEEAGKQLKPIVVETEELIEGTKTIEDVVSRTHTFTRSETLMTVSGPLVPVPMHVKISRPREPLITESEEGLIRRASKRKLDEDSVAVLVQPLSVEKAKKGKLDGAVAIHKKTSESKQLLVSREKRLFRSLTDLVMFDVELKHQTPIGQYEIEFIRRLESHDKASTEWDCVINRPQCTVYKFKGDSPVVLVKAYVVFDGVSVGILSHFIRHVPTRSNWDKTFEDYRLVETNIEGNEVIYCLMKAPWPVSNRDFLQWRRTQVEDVSNDVLIVQRSASHPDVPERAGVIRAETIISGYTIRTNGVESSAKLFIVAQTDVKGLLPKWAVNQGAQRAPLQWTEGLKKACLDYIKKHGSRSPDYSSLVSTM